MTAAIITMSILGSEVDPRTALTCRRRGAIKEQVDMLLHSCDGCRVAQDSICVPFLAECETWVWDTLSWVWPTLRNGLS